MKPASPEQAIFAEALKRDLPAARAAYLDGACGIATAMRRRVEALLRAAENAGDFLEQPPDGLEDADSTLPTIDLSEKPGDRIGRYKLLEKIGEGGCGVVYMAEQEEPVRRRIALKVIKLGMDTKQVIARFEAERQALAMMDHPNIAKVLDGGATQTGRPYFVMELVRGVRITEFCDEAQLSTRERISLFVQVCQAVQHAHQKGIIHRDLKPSNILVTVNDGAPVPKVIDFGIAKATGQRLTDKTLFTQFHSFIGTPAYTSPEQAEMSSVDIDTRSDIYSLGVLLYELLTGRTPFDGEQLSSVGFDEMRRIIRNDEPPRPSNRLDTLGLAEATALSGKRKVSVSEMAGDVRGDLDWIVMKCLEKDRARRYETANGIAADLQRHLRHEPVTARPPNGLYLLQKLAQRNRGALVTAATVLVAFVVALLALATSNARIRQERNQKDVALRERSSALDAARASEHQAREQLFVSLQNQAQARRNSRQVGQRTESLAALAEAARLRPTPELRDSAIAAMAMPDIQRGPLVPEWNSTNPSVVFDSRYEHTARIESDGSISIRDLQDHRELQRLNSSSGNAKPLARDSLRFSPDGRFILKFEERGSLRLWQWRTGQLVLTTPTEPGHLAVTFSSDGRHLAVGHSNAITCFDLETGRERRRWQVLNHLWSLAFHPDNKRLAAGYDQSDVVSIYDAEDARHLADLPIGMNTEEVVAWHPAGKLLAAAGSNPRIQIWDAEAKRQLTTLEGHVQQVTMLDFHPGGELLVSASWDNTLRLWHPTPGRFLMKIPALKWRGFSDNSQWSGDIRSTNEQAQLWGVVQSQEYHTFVGTFGDDKNWLTEGDISSDGRLLAIGASDGVRLWDIARGYEVAHLAMSVTTVAFRANGRELLTCGTLGGLQRRRIEGNSESGFQIHPAHRVPLPFAPARMAMSGDNRTLAVVGEAAGQCVLLDLETEMVRTTDMPHSRACYVALSADAKWIATSGWHSEQVKLWDGLGGKLIKTWDIPISANVFFTPDDRELIVARGNEFGFHDVNNLVVTRRMPRDVGLYPGHVAFTPDGKLMALEMTPGVIHLKEVANGRTVAKLEDPYGDLSTWMRFTPDGTQLLVAARYAGAIHRWDLRAIRARLKTMNLDWEWPEFAAPPDETSSPENLRRLRVQLVNVEPSRAHAAPATP